MLQVKFKKLNADAKFPVKGSLGAACFDVYATSLTIDGVGMITYGLGFSTEFPVGWKAVVVPRSNLSKHKWVMGNSIGIIDSDYRGEWMVKMKSIGPNMYEPTPYSVGDRIAQVYFEQVQDAAFVEVHDLSESIRGEGGFGSTGITDVTYAKPDFVTNTTADVKTNINS
jgi:dUTP pyrophosphatase